MSFEDPRANQVAPQPLVRRPISSWMRVLFGRDTAPLTRFERFILISMVATVGMERIDFLGGTGSFRLTPFLIVAPFGLIIALMRGVPRYLLSRKAPTRLRLGSVLLLAFLVVAVISSVTSISVVGSLRRTALLGIVALAMWAFVGTARKFDNADLIRIGAVVGLIFFIIFDAAQWISHASGYRAAMGAGGFLDLGTQPFGNTLIRLSGGLLDANRATPVVAAYVYLLLADPWVRKKFTSRWASCALLALGVVLAVGTLSRSGGVMFVMVAIGALRAIFPRLKLRTLSAWIAGCVAIVTAAVVGTIALAPKSLIAAVFNSRFNLFTDGSALSHFGLYQKGFEILNSHPAVLLHGIGWGNTYLYLKNALGATYFGTAHGTDYYTMFHSAYLTVVVETGVAGLLIFLAITITPMFSKRALLAIGVALFGVFYQALSDPAYWMVVAMLWLAPYQSRAVVEATSAPAATRGTSANPGLLRE